MDQGAIIGAIVLSLLAIYGYTKMFTSGHKTKRIKELLHKATIVDLRSNEEYRNGHLSNAMNIPLEKLVKSEKRLGKKNAPVVVYCASALRCIQGVRILKTMGFSKVINGGTLAQMQALSKKPSTQVKS